MDPNAEESMMRYLIEKLSQSPYNFDLNLASLANLEGESLCQVLFEVLVDIEPKLEEPLKKGDYSGMRELVRIMKYRPYEDDPPLVQEGLELGYPDIVLPFLKWAFSRIDILKTKAYLAPFLNKIHVPRAIISKEKELIELYQKYEKKISGFTKVHKHYTKLKSGQKESGATCKQNLDKLEKEMISIKSYIGLSKTKLEELVIRKNEDSEIYCDNINLNDSCDTSGCLLESGGGDNLTSSTPIICISNELKTPKEQSIEREMKNLKLLSEAHRLGLDKHRELQDQIEQEAGKLCKVESQAVKLIKKLKKLNKTNANLSHETLLQSVENDFGMLKFMVDERLPREMNEIERNILAMELVELNPPENELDVETLKIRLKSFQDEIAHLEDENDRTNEMLENDPAFMRVLQLAQKTRKKKEIRIKEAQRVKALLEVEKSENPLFTLDMLCQGPLDSRELAKEYRKLTRIVRLKMGRYKEMRNELNKLESDAKNLAKKKMKLELQSELGKLGNKIKDGLDVKDFQLDPERIEAFKKLRKESKAKKSEYRKILIEYKELKKCKVDLELAKKIEELQSKNLEIERTKCDLTAKINLFKSKMDLVQNEENSGSKISSEKVKLLGMIAEQERVQKELEDEKLKMEKNEPKLEQQKQMWLDLTKHFKAKIEAKKLKQNKTRV